jgi:hypothetical protein
MKAEVEKRLERHGLSSSGRNWVLKALNPVSDHETEGIPDESTTPVLRPEFRVEATISPPPGAGTLWDLYVYALPGDVNAVYWASAPSPADFTTATPPVGYAVGAIQMQGTVPNTNSVSYYNAPLSANDTVIGTHPVSRPLAFRHFYKSLTMHLIAPAVANQGTIYSAQFPPRFSTVSGTSGTQEVNLSSVPYVIMPRPLRIPLSETELMLMAPDAFVGPARDGVYMPLHLAGPTQPYTTALVPTAVTYSSPGVGTLIDGANSYLTESFGHAPWLVRDEANSWPTLAARPFANAAVAAIRPIPSAWDSNYDNMNVGVTIFRGLAGTAAGAFGATVQIKALVGLEIVPRPLAPDRVFARRAALYDPRALEAYYSVLHELHQAYPASYNAFGALAPIITSVLSRLAPVLLPMAASAGSALMKGAVERFMPQRPMTAQPRLTAPTQQRAAPAPAAKQQGKPRRKMR